jgi:DHA2 family methylenomycin A resistance protein-like MFS transporter
MSAIVGESVIPIEGSAARSAQSPLLRPALAVAMLGFAAVALDAQVTNVALPSIHRDLGGGLAGLQWIVTGYTLMFSALLLFRRHLLRPDRDQACV